MGNYSRVLLTNYSRNFSLLRNILSLEVLFTLFLFAGVYKSWTLLSWAPDLTGVFAILTGLAAAVAIYQNSLVDKRAVILVCLWYLFLIYSFISIYWSPSEVYVVEKSIKLLTVTSLSIIVPAIIISRSQRRISRLIFSILIFAAVVTIAALYEFMITPPGANLEPFNAVYLLVGRVVGFGFLISFYLTLYEWRSQRRVIGIFSTAGFGFILIASGGRGPLVATTISAILLLILTAISKRKRVIPQIHIIGGAFGIVATVLGILITAIGTMPKTIHRLYLLITGQRTQSVGTRIEYYHAAAEQWHQSPIFGVGLAGWPIEFGVGDIRSYPHNIILEIAAELGTVGLILFFLPILYIISNVRPLPKRLLSPYSILVVVLFIYMLMNSFVTGDITDNRYFFMILGLSASVFHDNSFQ